MTELRKIKKENKKFNLLNSQFSGGQKEKNIPIHALLNLKIEATKIKIGWKVRID